MSFSFKHEKAKEVLRTKVTYNPPRGTVYFLGLDERSDWERGEDYHRERREEVARPPTVNPKLDGIWGQYVLLTPKHKLLKKPTKSLLGAVGGNPWDDL